MTDVSEIAREAMDYDVGHEGRLRGIEPDADLSEARAGVILKSRPITYQSYP